MKINLEKNSNIKVSKINCRTIEEYQKINKKITIDLVTNIKTFIDANKIADVIVANITYH